MITDPERIDEEARDAVALLEELEEESYRQHTATEPKYDFTVKPFWFWHTTPSGVVVWRSNTGIWDRCHVMPPLYTWDIR